MSRYHFTWFCSALKEALRCTHAVYDFIGKKTEKEREKMKEK